MTIRNVVTRASQYETIIPFALEQRAEGEYINHLHIQGNSLLCSVYVSQIDVGATLHVDYFDTTTGDREGEEYILGAHPTLSVAPMTNRITITRIHEAPRIRVRVVGGSARFGVMMTVVTSFATDLDAALIFDEQVANLLRDKAIPIAGYDNTGKYNFIRVQDGILQVGGEVTAGELFINKRLYNEVLGQLPSTDVTLINYTVPVGKLFRWLEGFGTSNNWTTFDVQINGVTWIFQNNAFDNPNVNLTVGRGVRLNEGDTLTVTVRNVNPYNEPADIRTGIFGVEQDA